MKKRLKKKMDRKKGFTLQDAWDMISDHLGENKASHNPSHTYFVNSIESGYYGCITLHTANSKILLASTKKY